MNTIILCTLWNNKKYFLSKTQIRGICVCNLHWQKHSFYLGGQNSTNRSHFLHVRRPRINVCNVCWLWTLLSSLWPAWPSDPKLGRPPCRGCLKCQQDETTDTETSQPYMKAADRQDNQGMYIYVCQKKQEKAIKLQWLPLPVSESMIHTTLQATCQDKIIYLQTMQNLKSPILILSQKLKIPLS